MERNKDRLKIILAFIWLAFTVTLAGWWMVFGLQQLERMRQLAGTHAGELHHYYSMLLWEGGVLVVLLLGGGVALLSYIWRERRRHRQIEEFFAAFTHDAKTSLASLRLQAESLWEDQDHRRPNPVLVRLLKDTLRLQLQLENSLFLVNLRSGRLLTETVRISRLVEFLRFHWPEVAFKLVGDGEVVADIRALESVLTNLIQNAVTHGRSNQIRIGVDERDPGRLSIRVADNGKGFNGDFDQLGTLFMRPTKGSGSGVGLYISRQLVKRMGGALGFSPGAEGGFVAELTLPQSNKQDLAQQVKQTAT